MAFSNSRLSTYRRCRLRYYWTYNNHKGEEQQGSLALRRGKAGHVALAEYYMGLGIGPAIAKGWEAFNPTWPDSEAQMLKLDESLHRYLTWANTNDNWEVLEVEKTIEAEYKGKKIMGIWDLLVKRNGLLWIVDHKFNKSHTTSHLEVDSQISFYLSLAKCIGLEVRGAIYNIINLEAGKNRPPATRQIINRSDRFLGAYLESLLPEIAEVELLDQGLLPVYANWTHDCHWDCSFYRRCLENPYREELQEDG